MFKVLVVEDQECYWESIKHDLEAKEIVVLLATTIEEAEKLFKENPEVDAISMDACVPGDEPNTIPLLGKIIKSGYKGVIYVCSKSRTFVKLLLEAGREADTDFEKLFPSFKDEVAEDILDWLGIE